MKVNAAAQFLCRKTLKSNIFAILHNNFELNTFQDIFLHLYEGSALGAIFLNSAMAPYSIKDPPKVKFTVSVQVLTSAVEKRVTRSN